MQNLEIDAVVVGWSQHVYYFTAYRPFWLQEAAFLLFSDGRSTAFVAGKTIDAPAADDLIEFQASWDGTQRQDQPAAVAAMVVDQLKGRKVRRLALDASAVSSQILLQRQSPATAADPLLWQMRRAKDPDELILMRKAFACADAMYARARQIIEPGIDEIHLFAELHAAAVRVAGEPLSAVLGNDYSCGVGGGPPRGGKQARAGEIYILDVGPAYRGYFADASRGFSVDGNPTDAQREAHAALAGCFPIVETLARPGVRCRDVYAAVDQHLKSKTGVGLTHHLGHGIGLQPHEFPHLNMRWDDVLIEGEVFTVEPGLYGSHLAGGIRLENTYLIKSTGLENLVTAPLDL
jgi:Xaa-Pro dipeptidase